MGKVYHYAIKDVKSLTLLIEQDIVWAASKARAPMYCHPVRSTAEPRNLFAHGVMTPIERHLEELGLKENEAKVYLASLELGPATAQQLAAKAVVARPTTYVAVEGLMKRGLMSSYKKGKKEYVQAEKPERLLKILEDEKRRLAERESKLKSLLPGLEALIAASGDKPEVKYYEGLEGLEAMREVLFESKEKRVDVIGSSDAYNRTIPEASRVFHSYEMKKRAIGGRQIFLSTYKKIIAIEFVDKTKWQFKTLSKEDIPPSELAVFGQHVSLVVYSDKPFGILIRSKEIAALARLMFEGTWRNLK